MAEDDYWREEYARNPPAAEPDHAARLAAKDAEIERLQAMVKRAGEQLQASTRTMDKARDRIVELERDLDTALAAKDAEIERLQEYVMGKATIATKDLLGKLQAAEAEVARLKGINELQADLLNGAIKRARDERERCARVAERLYTKMNGLGIAAAIRAG